MREFQTQQVFILDYSEFDALTKEVYGREYDFVPSEEANNDSEYYFPKVTAAGLDEYDSEQLRKFINGEEVNWLTRALLQDLCFKGEIPPGNYLIRVCW